LVLTIKLLIYARIRLLLKKQSTVGSPQRRPQPMSTAHSMVSNSIEIEAVLSLSVTIMKLKLLLSLSVSILKLKLLLSRSVTVSK